jgi:membrane protein YqaA with SNARE-associated domain
MEYFGVALLGVLIFLLGWVTGNVVEWILDYRQRRLFERWLADENKQLFLKERQARE